MKLQAVIAMTLLILATLVGIGWAAVPQQITITMRDFSYKPNRITLQAGVPAEITLGNQGKVAHEFMVYDMPKSMGQMMGHEWVEKTNYFHMVPVTTAGGKVSHHGSDFMELRVAPGKTATLKFTPVKKGTFEFGCMIEGHYEAGQKGVLVVK